jgi:hypothetical protein
MKKKEWGSVEICSDPLFLSTELVVSPYIVWIETLAQLLCTRDFAERVHNTVTTIDTIKNFFAVSLQ